MDDADVVLKVTQCGNVEEINRACSKVQWETNVKKLAVHHFSFQMLILQLSCLCVPGDSFAVLPLFWGFSPFLISLPWIFRTHLVNFDWQCRFCIGWLQSGIKQGHFFAAATSCVH